MVFEELMKPDKKEVGKRIKMVKEQLNVSLTELGRRLGLSKSRINSYVQGYSLATVEVLESLSKFSGKTVGWFYFGDMEDYIKEYLIKRGYEKLLKDYPDIPVNMKKEFINNISDCWEWQNNFGYPRETSMDSLFGEIYHKILQKYFRSLTEQYLKNHFDLDKTKREEAIIIISGELYNIYRDFWPFEYGDEEAINNMIETLCEENIKEEKILVSDNYLPGKLINILESDEETNRLIELLSNILTNQTYHPTALNRELTNILQTMRPALLKLYMEVGELEMSTWFSSNT